MGACIAFCLVTSAVAFLISTLMSRESIATFTIPAIEHDWDLQQKAAACRNAGFMYLLLALLLTGKTFFYKPQQSRARRVIDYGYDERDKEASPLVASQDVAEEDEDDPSARARRCGIPVTRASARVYGSVEMKEHPRDPAQ